MGTRGMIERVLEAAALLSARFARDGGQASRLLGEGLRALEPGLSGPVAAVFYASLRHDRKIEMLLGPDANADGRATLAAAIIGLIGWDETGLSPALAAARCADISDPLERFGVEHSLPSALAARLLLGDISEPAALARAFLEEPPLTARATGDRTALISALAAAGIPGTPGRWSDRALMLEIEGSVYETEAFQSGRFELQDEGSQLIAELVAPPPGGVVLDLCAGAGGKTLAIAALLQGKGRVIATDVHPRKLEELARRARRAGLHNIQTAAIEGEDLPELVERLRGKIDRVLVDAPCTGLGVLRRNPEAKHRYDPASVRELGVVQAKLLAQATALLGPGARAIYATCSFLPEENQAPVEAALALDPELELVSPAEIWGRARAELLLSEDRRFLALRPDRHDTDAFFAAVLRRKRPRTKPHSSP